MLSQSRYVRVVCQTVSATKVVGFMLVLYVLNLTHILCFQADIFQVVSPNEFAKHEHYFKNQATWTRSTGWLTHKKLCFYLKQLSYISITGFQPKEAIFKSTYDDLDGHELNIVMPNGSLLFSQVYTYPDKLRLRTGVDYMAALYFGEALNFRPRYIVSAS